MRRIHRSSAIAEAEIGNAQRARFIFIESEGGVAARRRIVGRCHVDDDLLAEGREIVEGEKRAVQIADNGVHVAVAVEVDESSARRELPMSTPSNGLAAPVSSVKVPPVFSNVRSKPYILPTTASMSPSPSRSTKLGRGKKADVNAIERIGGAGQLGEGAADHSRRRAGRRR